MWKHRGCVLTVKGERERERETRLKGVIKIQVYFE